MATEGRHAVSLALKGRILTVGAKVANVGEVNTEIDILGWTATPDAEIHFNPNYLLEYLKASPGEEVTIHYNDPRSAVKLTDGTGGSYIVMPITVAASE